MLQRRRERRADQTGGAWECGKLLMAVLGAVVVDHEHELAGGHLGRRTSSHAQQRGSRCSLNLLKLHQLELRLCLGHGASHSMLLGL
jgi:hypothetical protein